MYATPKRKRYRYACSCVDSTARLIEPMVDQAREVSYATVQRQCSGLVQWSEQHGYARLPANGLTLKNDWHVSYHKSRFRNRPCYYVCWSAIEFIWTLES